MQGHEYWKHRRFTFYKTLSIRDRVPFTESGFAESCRTSNQQGTRMFAQQVFREVQSPRYGCGGQYPGIKPRVFLHTAIEPVLFSLQSFDRPVVASRNKRVHT